MSTGIWMCLSCGHFHKEFKEGASCALLDQCPRCKSTFFVDNVIEGKPPIMTPEEEVVWQEERLKQLGI